MNKPDITAEKIAIENALIRWPKAARKRIAIENVVFSYPHREPTNNAMNLARDGQLYGWPTDVMCAMKYALREIGKL